MLSPRRHLPPVLLALPVLLLAGCGTVPTSPAGGAASPATTPSAGASSVEPDGTGPSDGACAYTVTGSPARPVQPPTTSDISSSGTVSYVLHRARAT